MKLIDFEKTIDDFFDRTWWMVWQLGDFMPETTTSDQSVESQCGIPTLCELANAHCN